MSAPVRIVSAGDSALIVEIGDRIDLSVNQRAVALAAALRDRGIAGVRDVVPTIKSVAVYFDPLRIDARRLRQLLAEQAEVEGGKRTSEESVVTVPVCYGGEFGPDLSEIARFAGLGEAEVVALHASRTYRVFMIGFMPGFAYMASVAPKIAAPRLASPRLRVAAGSVGIAGEQTGIYPSDSPGGWRLIGRTPLKPYDLHRKKPFLFEAGDRVRFDPIDMEQYEAWRRSS